MNEIWKKISQPANTGRVWYERGYKTAGAPSALVLYLFSLLQDSAATHLFHHVGDRVFPPRKRREGDWIEGGLHQDRRLWDLDFESHLHPLSQGTLILDLI